MYLHFLQYLTMYVDGADYYNAADNCSDEEAYMTTTPFLLSPKKVYSDDCFHNEAHRFHQHHHQRLIHYVYLMW